VVGSAGVYSRCTRVYGVLNARVMVMMTRKAGVGSYEQKGGCG
jgi:hypothetical protein